MVPMVSLRQLNTQIAEQTNSVLERIRTQVWATSSLSIHFPCLDERKEFCIPCCLSWHISGHEA